MKRLLLIGVLAVALTLTAAFPGKPYKIYKNHGRSTATAAEAPSNQGGDAAAIFREQTTVPATPGPPPSPTSHVIPSPIGIGASKVEPLPSVASEDPSAVTSKSKLGENPVGEPTKAPAIPDPAVPVPAFPPAIPDGEAVQPAAIAASEPSHVPVVDATTPKEAAVPSASPDKVTNATSSSEEDESSEEEAEEDEDDEGRRLIPSKRKSKSRPFPIEVGSKIGGRQAGSPKNPPLKYDLVVNGFVTEDGQVLVPFDTYQKYFHNGESKALPPVYAITRDESQGPSTSAVVSEESEADKSSEERVQAVPLPNQDKINTESQSGDSSETPAQGSGSSEEGEKEVPAASTNSGESEEKVAPSAENEKPVVSNEVRPVPGTAPIFRPPPLQALPARLPTSEDDEEEAGRYLDQYGIYPPIDYDDDVGFQGGHNNHKSIYYDY